MNRSAIKFEMQRRYLDSGLVPVSGFSLEDVQSFLQMLQSLSKEEQRLAKRKFRKKWRKLLKKLDPEQVFDLNGTEHVLVLKSRRRRAVHEDIRQSAEREVEDYRA
jgi:hypothetical protein